MSVALQCCDHSGGTVPRSFRSYGDRAFGVYTPKMWNSLPLHLRNSTSLASFKKALKTFLFVDSF